MSPARLSAFMRPILEVLIGLFVIGCIVSWIRSDNEYEDDEFSVTITYECEKVLNGRNYPSEVISECLDLRDEIKRRNNK